MVPQVDFFFLYLKPGKRRRGGKVCFYAIFCRTSAPYYLMTFEAKHLLVVFEEIGFVKK